MRLARLRAREAARYGARIAPGADMEEVHAAFMAWAASYDAPGFHGRNRRRHEAWLAELASPVLRVDGARPVGEELVRAVLAAVPARAADTAR